MRRPPPSRPPAPCPCDETDGARAHGTARNRAEGYAYQRQFEALVGPEGGNIIPTPIPDAPGADNTFVFLNTQELFDKDVYSHVPDNDTFGGPLGPYLGTPGVDTPQCFCEDSPNRTVRWAINRKSFHVADTPLLHGLYFGTDKRTKEELEAEGYYELVLGEVRSRVNRSGRAGGDGADCPLARID